MSKTSRQLLTSKTEPPRHRKTRSESDPTKVQQVTFDISSDEDFPHSENPHPNFGTTREFLGTVGYQKNRKNFPFYGIGEQCKTRRRARYAKIAKSVATHSIEYIRGEATKKLTDFFIKERENHN